MKQRTALVTGASSGIGAAIANGLSANGLKVIGTSRRASSIDGFEQDAISMTQLDVCDLASCEQLKARFDEAGIEPDLLILNAGMGIAGAVEETSDELVLQQFETNLFGVHRMVRAFLPGMRATGEGQIIIIGSLAAQMAVPFQTFYSSSKAAVANYAEGLRMEVAAFGISVSLIEPGDHRSDFGAGRKKASSSPEGPYEPQATRALSVMEENEQTGPPVQRVADLAVRVASKRNPKFRYWQCKPDEWIVLGLKPYLPHSFLEKVVMGIFKVPGQTR